MQLERAMAFHRWALESEGKAPGTLENYGLAERVFASWCADVLGERAPTLALLTVENVRRFLDYLRTEHRSPRKGGVTVGHGPASLRYYARVLKTWGRFLVREEILPSDPLERLRPPRIPRTVVPALTRDEFARMLRLAASTRDPHRNRAILIVLVETGLRVSELCSLRLDQVELATPKRRGAARVMGKGSCERIVRFGAEASRALAKYWQLERPQDSRSPLAFLGREGGILSRHAVQEMVHELAPAAGITGKRVSPHVLRHTYGTWQAAAGTNSFRIAEQLGHRSLEMTRRYVELAQVSGEDGFHSLLDGWEGLR